MTDYAKRYTGWNVILSNSNPIKKNYRPIFFLILSFLSFLDYIWLAYNYISPCSLHFMALLSQLFVFVFYQHKRLCAVRYSSHPKESFFFATIDQHRCSSGAKIFYFEIVLLLLTFCSLPYFSWFAFFVAVVPSLLTVALESLWTEHGSKALVSFWPMGVLLVKVYWRVSQGLPTHPLLESLCINEKQNRCITWQGQVSMRNNTCTNKNTNKVIR